MSVATRVSSVRVALALVATVATVAMPRIDAYADPTPRVADERIVLHTEYGDLVLALFPDVAPRHVEQLLKLAQAGAYDTTFFYRVHPSFVAQLGTVEARREPLTDEQRALIKPIPAEFSDLKHVRGTLSMAHDDGKPDSASTSFSILLGTNPHLDGKYTIFGRLESGDEVLDAFEKLPRDTQHRPIERIEVVTAEVVSSPGELARLSRAPAAAAAAGARDASVPASAATGGQPAAPFLVLVGVMMSFGLATFLLAGRASARTVGSLGLLTTLVGAFLVYTALAPISSAGHSWLAVALFVSSIGLFKLMSWFESEPTAKPSAAQPGAERAAKRP